MGEEAGLEPVGEEAGLEPAREEAGLEPVGEEAGLEPVGEEEWGGRGLRVRHDVSGGVSGWAAASSTRSSSEMTGTPNCSASSRLPPGSSPTTT